MTSSADSPARPPAAAEAGPQRHRAGRIAYAIDFVDNPAYVAGARGLFSEALLRRLERANVPSRRVVFFDGGRSRVEEINSDYGVTSPSLLLRDATRSTETYCKQLTDLAFCVDRPLPGESTAPLVPPTFEPLAEVRTVAGLACRKGRHSDGVRPQVVWYAPGLLVDDPTGAVERREGVPGLLAGWEVVPAAKGVSQLQRVTVQEIALGPQPAALFAVPSDHQRFPSVDAARLENRRRLKARAAAEAAARPLAEAERRRFEGRWHLVAPDDAVVVDVEYAGDKERWTNRYRFRTTILSAPTVEGRRPVERPASLQGRTLLVEEPPNFALYDLTDDGRGLALRGNPVFSYRRASEAEGKGGRPR